MRRSLLLFIAIIFTSCSAHKIIGEYEKVGSDFKYNLKLNKNHTFLFKGYFFDGDGQCNGKWRFITKDTILLECKKEDILIMLQRGSMSERIQKVVILNNGQIKIKQVILTKR